MCPTTRRAPRCRMSCAVIRPTGVGEEARADDQRQIAREVETRGNPGGDPSPAARRALGNQSIGPHLRAGRLSKVSWPPQTPPALFLTAWRAMVNSQQPDPGAM